MATTLLRWFVIQIAAYGAFSLAGALLNTRRRFVAVAWGPIVNNVVCIVVLIWFGLWAGRHASLASVANHPGQLMLLGLGTSLGVVLQGVALIPSLRAANLRGLRGTGTCAMPALRTVIRLSGWTFGFVVANQISGLRHHPFGRHGGGDRPRLLLHLRLRVLADALWHRGRHGHVGGRAGPGAAVDVG